MRRCRKRRRRSAGSPAWQWSDERRGGGDRISEYRTVRTSRSQSSGKRHSFGTPASHARVTAPDTVRVGGLRAPPEGVPLFGYQRAGEVVRVERPQGPRAARRCRSASPAGSSCAIATAIRPSRNRASSARRPSRRPPPRTAAPAGARSGRWSHRRRAASRAARLAASARSRAEPWRAPPSGSAACADGRQCR